MPPKKEPQKRGRKAEEKLSTFLVTINPNQLKRQNVKLLKKSIENFYDDLENYIKHKSDKVKVSKISCDSAIEKGEKRSAHHAHLLIKIFHTGKIHLDLEKMRKYFDSEIPLGDDKSNYISIKYINDPSYNIQKYFNKENIDV